MKLRNLIAVIRDQMPLKRFWINFFVTRNAWGLFYIQSHIRGSNGVPKIGYPTKESALRAAESMKKKHGKHFSAYKCLHCDDFHLGKNRDNK